MVAAEDAPAWLAAFGLTALFNEGVIAKPELPEVTDSAAPTTEKLSINNKPNAKHIAFLPIFIIKTISYVKLAKILAENSILLNILL
jgi:hypothetical protein